VLVRDGRPTFGLRPSRMIALTDGKTVIPKIGCQRRIE
jgi:hypothetical protein